MTPPAGRLAVWPVVTIDGQHRAMPADGEHVALVEQLNAVPPGWRPLFVYTGCFPIYLLELRHDDGRESTWFLDQRFGRLAFDDPRTLAAADLAVLRRRAGEVIARMWDQLLAGVDPRPEPVVTGFLSLNSAIRGRLAELCEPDFARRSVTIDLETARQRGIKAFHTCRGATFDTGVMWRIMTSDLLTRSLEAMRAGLLEWESPVGGPALTTSGGIWLTDFLYVYRVVAPGQDLAFYVLASGHPCQVIGILLPEDRVVFTIGARCRDNVEKFHDVPIDVLLLRHFCHHGARMIDAWRAGSSGFSVVFRERLISGQIWHDLTGLDQLSRLLPTRAMPEIIGMWGNVPEIYGDTEDIFPETQGRINRSIADDGALIRHAYDQRRVLLRTTGSYVTKRLYQRLIAVNARDPGIAPVLATLQRIRSLHCPLVLLGLRVENRTVDDLPEFCAQVIDYLIRRCGQVAIVIDGHNSARGGTPDLPFASEFQQHAKEAPIDAERRVVRALRERYDDGAVILVDNIGGSMARSIFWCQNADFFITMYGTGLAKYRWACNQTGLIVTSRWTLRNQGHLHIYEQEFLEDPAPLMFLPERFVEDLPDSPRLISEPGDPPARWNFRIRLEGLHAAIDALLLATGAAARLSTGRIADRNE